MSLKVESEGRASLHGGWLVASRMAWLAVTLVVFGLWVWDTFILHPELPNAILFSVIMPLGYFTTASILFWRRSDQGMGLLASLMLIILGPYLLSGVSNTFALHPIGRFPNAILETLGGITSILFFYLFPNGQFVPRWTRRLAVITVFLLVAAALYTLAVQPRVEVINKIFAASVPVGFFAQVYRYGRVSNPVQRQQTKWVMVGLLGPVFGFFWYLFVLLPGIMDLSSPIVFLATALILGSVILLLPLSILFAILRYRLWDIDILIRRTLVYGVLSALLALVYFGSVVLLQGLFRALTGQGSQLAVVVSTLVIAALFNPVRRRLQTMIDQRFYRRRYDAQQTLAAFSAALRARDNADLDKLSSELLGVIQQTMQPAHLSLWLRDDTATLSKDSYTGKPL